ncbi:MAG: hypothetical protein WA254_00650 [Candidatus Sulfotelmatobacter sp.]
MKMRDFVQSETAVATAVDKDVIARFTHATRTVSRDGHPPATTVFVAAVFGITILALLAGCNSSTTNTPPAQPQPKPPELLTGRAAFYKTFIAARNYAADVKPFRIESTPSSESNGQDGKSAIWRISYASATQHGVKPFFWSGSNAPDAPSRGVSPGNEDVYNPGNASTQVFDPAFLKVDTDQAFTEAQKHGGDKILEKDPTTPVLYTCEWNHNTNQLVWQVIYGTSRETAKLTVSVDASSGAFIRVEK